MVEQEQLDLLAQGVAAWNQWKENTSEVLPGLRWHFLRDADLSDADLREADLSGINLQNVELWKTSFAGADLAGADLAKSEPLEANFTHARLNGANLSETNASGADFTHADLRNADLRSADLSDACFQGADLRGANLSSSYLEEANFQGADLRGADLSRAYLGKARFEDAFLNEANLSHARYGILAHFVKVHQMKAAGAIVRPTNTNRQRTERVAKVLTQRKSQDIILFPRAIKVLGATVIAFLFAIAGIGLMQTPGRSENVVMGIFIALSCGLGGVIGLFRYLRLLLSHTPLLVINDEGIGSSLAARAEYKTRTTDHNSMFTWQEIGAIGVIITKETNLFAIYSIKRRWRTSWCPSLKLSESFLPIPAKEIIKLIHERYQDQLVANHITTVELIDDGS